MTIEVRWGDPRGSGAAFVRCRDDTCNCQRDPNCRDPLNSASKPVPVAASKPKR